jgi:Domain of unknown function (DUF4349)
MRSLVNLSIRARVLIALVLVCSIALTTLSLTLLGGKVDYVFTSINSGLSAGSPSGATPAGVGVSAQERMVIRNASLVIEVADVTLAEDKIRTFVNQVGGYILSSSTSGEGNSLNVSLITKVPAGQFDTTLSTFQALASKVRERSVTGEDVTAEFVDLTARLHNLEVTRDRVESLLGQATLVDDMLKINTALGDLQGQIEQIQGRMQYLSQNVAVSTITVSVKPVPVVTIFGTEDWQPVMVARGALRNMIAACQGLLNLLITVVVWLPLIGPSLLLAWWVWKRLPRRGQPLPESQAGESEK